METQKAGVAKQVLDLEQVVCDDIWTEEREKLAQEHLSQDKSTIPVFWQHKYENEAAKNWDTFYKRNANNFYKDRHIYTWSLKISASSPSLWTRGHCWRLDVALGMLHYLCLRIILRCVYVAIDFAESSADIIWTRTEPTKLYDEARVAASVCDITQDPLPDAAFANGGVDFALFFFCQSALHPDKIKGAVKNVVNPAANFSSVITAGMTKRSFASVPVPSCRRIFTSVKTRAYYFTIKEVKALFERSRFNPSRERVYSSPVCQQATESRSLPCMGSCNFSETCTYQHVTQR
ncbi:hypothetical protein PsorP6_004314 [Peronosclerospora sorghi]|uniref:Uncharacterized protein n=1 Tax=Peronosclerospora sorghi TaxID=230839 RepID=A0ACC0VMD3_9STRA|nr:hypothetical protein PsorP6_004314 [Peronosclerospora sorghi]